MKVGIQIRTPEGTLVMNEMTDAAEGSLLTLAVDNEVHEINLVPGKPSDHIEDPEDPEFDVEGEGSNFNDNFQGEH